MAAERRASSLPPANPFWSDRTQADHELEQMRPVNLESWEAPVPHDDDDLDQSPRVPLPSGVSGHDAKPAALTLDSEKPCVEEPQKLETEVTYEPLQHDQATGKRPEEGCGIEGDSVMKKCLQKLYQVVMKMKRKRVDWRKIWGIKFCSTFSKRR